MSATDQLLARLTAEAEEHKTFQDRIVAAANEEGRDLNPQEMELHTRATTRLTEINRQMEPLAESARIAIESANRTRQLVQTFETARGPAAIQQVEYRSAGQYIADVYHAALGDNDAGQRVELFHRAAAHQTTADNAGLLPETIVGPVVNFVDESRPLVNAIGVTDLGEGSWAYAKVTQHTQVGAQSAEKAELASRKMLITKTAIDGTTYGGYVNISRQDIRRTSPGILDMVLADLAGQYAIETEEAAGSALVAAATAGNEYPATPTASELATAIYGAAGDVFTATAGQGRVIIAVSPDMLGLIAPLFPPINPQNAYGMGFNAPVMSGPQGTVGGLGVVMSAGLAAGTILVLSTAAVRVFEYKYGNMQLGEPSVWGVQVGYAGDFETISVNDAGIQSLVEETP